jgi:hypothetical protein
MNFGDTTLGGRTSTNAFRLRSENANCHGIVANIAMRSVCPYLFLLAAVCFSALADPTPSDPEILIDIGCCSDSLSTQFNNIQPNGNFTTVFDNFKNDTGGIVTSLTFTMTIAKGLTSDQISSGFSCPSPMVKYFLSCATPYDAGSGLLQYEFFGVNPADGDDNASDPPTEQEGIPVGGDFKITLVGWTAGATVGDNNTPLFDQSSFHFNNTFTATPEPSQIVLLVVASLLLVSIAGIIRRREKRKEESIPSA